MFCFPSFLHLIYNYGWSETHYAPISPATVNTSQAISFVDVNYLWYLLLCNKGDWKIVATVADYIRNILSSAKKLYITTTTGSGPDAVTTDSQLFEYTTNTILIQPLNVAQIQSWSNHSSNRLHIYIYIGSKWD